MLEYLGANLVAYLLGEMSGQSEMYKSLASSTLVHQPIIPNQLQLLNSPHSTSFTMQFFKSAVVAVMAFAAVAVATPWGPTECKPLLQSCDVNSECCGDLCVAGVSADPRFRCHSLLTAHMIALHLNYHFTYPINYCVHWVI